MGWLIWSARLVLGGPASGRRLPGGLSVSYILYCRRVSQGGAVPCGGLAVAPDVYVLVVYFVVISWWRAVLRLYFELSLLQSMRRYFSIYIFINNYFLFFAGAW